MFANCRTVLVVLSMLFGLVIYSSEAQAYFAEAVATGGAQLALNTYDWTDGWAGDYEALATNTTTVAPYRDYGYAKSTLNGAGVELRSKSYAPDVYANSTARLSDYFRLSTISGSQGAVLNAVMNFELTGSITMHGDQNSGASFGVDLSARQGDFTPYLDIKQIRYKVYWDSLTGQYVGTNENDDWDNLFQVNPTKIGNTYNFTIPLSLDLNDMLADELTFLKLSINTRANDSATADFSNTLKTNQDNPFVLTSISSGSSYQLATDYGEVDGVSLFGNLDGEILTPVPVPPTIILLGTGMLGLAMASRKRFGK